MAKRRRRDKSTERSSAERQTPKSDRELIVVLKPAARGTASPAAAARAASSSLSDLLPAGASIRPLFGRTAAPAATSDRAAGARADDPTLSSYFRVDAPDESLDELATKLAEHESVEAAYVKPPAEPARLNEMAAGL
jgi:hypothetical protein